MEKILYLLICSSIAFGAAERSTTGAVAVVAAGGEGLGPLTAQLATLLPIHLDTQNAATSLVRATDALNTAYMTPLAASSIEIDRLSALAILLVYDGNVYKGIAENKHFRCRNTANPRRARLFAPPFGCCGLDHYQEFIFR